MSSLRARCPNCRTFTAVAVGDGYECHRCGRSVRGRARARAAAWGEGGEAMAEGARDRAPVPGGRRRRARHARGADGSRRRLARRAADRPRWMLLHARRGGARSRATSRPARRRLDRRARRPQHARDVAVGKPVGDAVAHDPRRRRRPRRGRRARRRAKPRSARGRVHRSDRDRRLARPRARRDRRRLRRARSRRARSERGRRPHPRAGRAVGGRDRGAAPGDRRASHCRGHRRHRPRRDRAKCRVVTRLLARPGSRRV